MCEARHLDPAKVEVGIKIQRPHELQWESIEINEAELLKIGAAEKDLELSICDGEFWGVVLKTAECNADGGLFSPKEIKAG